MSVKTAQQAHTDTTLIMARLFNAPKPWKTVVPLLALLGAALTKPLANVLGGKTYLRRTVLLSLVTQLMILAVLIVAAIVRVVGVGIGLDRLVVLATASTVWIRQVVMASTSQSHPVKNLPSILVQPVL